MLFLVPCRQDSLRNFTQWMRDGQSAHCGIGFVGREQISEIGERHPELGWLRLVVTRSGEADLMTLKAETAAPEDALQSELSATLRAVTKLGGNVDWSRLPRCRTSAR